MKIKVIVKVPGKAPEMRTVRNELQSLQQLVGGNIETVTVSTDLVIICNEEGRLRNLPYNMTLLGIDFLGTIVFAGAKGDEFADVPESDVIRRMARG